MKKLLYLFIALFICSCAGKSADKKASSEEMTVNGKSVSMGDTANSNKKSYEGILPAADAEGIRYELDLYTPKQGTGDSIYHLTMTYIGAGENGQDETFVQQGQWGIVNGPVIDAGGTIYQLRGDSIDEINFLAVNDSLVMLGQDMKKPQSKLNYTLKEKK
ncbi:copper resistance protein NlpE [Coprobacter tertius]|uniref:Copper resistance protein NlpE n=1 Tax=Coprobacter tertius TaxID=2944915 RepID=A0ABT1MGD5_9BACT|nr:copper resistance protein NlpE [Coprobacter tertius]MCP9611429.1 copper resistance protein NlpE [Coprobacter tertius]